jgi:hypothetical protein
MNQYIVVAIIFTIILIILLSIYNPLSKLYNKLPSYYKTKLFNSDTTLDPLMDPAYNVKEVCKQSVLLEEHLSNPKKRCSDCITKHFLLITGYIEEAVQLAGDKVDKYPYLQESCKIYNDLFKKWLEVKKTGMDDKKLCEISSLLRIQRKKLVSEYINK